MYTNYTGIDILLAIVKKFESFKLMSPIALEKEKYDTRFFKKVSR